MSMTDAFALTPEQAPIFLDIGLQALAQAARHFNIFKVLILS